MVVITLPLKLFKRFGDCSERKVSELMPSQRSIPHLPLAAAVRSIAAFRHE